MFSYFKFCLFQSCIKMFGAGYVIQALIKLVSLVGRVLKQPKAVIHALFNRNNTQLGAFLGLFVGTYKVSGYSMSGQKLPQVYLVLELFKIIKMISFGAFLNIFLKSFIVDIY